MQQFIAIVSPDNIMDNHRQDMLACLDAPGLTGIDVRWSLAGETNAVKRNIAALQLIRAARDRGLEVRMHGWVGSHLGLSKELAQSQARQFAKICHAEGISAFGINAEKDVWSHGLAAALAFLEDFLNTFYETGRRTHAAYLGFVDPAYHYGKGYVIPDEHKRRYWQVWQMIYQWTADAIEDKIELGERVWPEHARNYYVSCGRIASNGDIVGAWPVWRKLAESGRVDCLTWYVGNGRAWEQLVQGNAKHPPLLLAIPILAGLLEA